MIWKKIGYVALVVLGFLVLSYGFVPQVLEGKIVNQSDISGWQGMSHEMMEWNSAHPDDETAWTESMFGGMPTTTIHASTKGDFTQGLYDFLLLGRRPATYLFISLLGAWLLMLSFGVHPLLAIGGAIAITFCSYNLQIIQVGHNTKMQAIAFLPWVLAALVYTFKEALGEGRRSLAYTALGAALFALTLSFQVKANHPQITYYLAILILVYALVLLISLLISKEKRSKLGRFFVASGLLLVLGLAGIGTNAIKLLPTYEYTPYSMRGGSSDKSADDSHEGLALDYATAWSYGWEELPNLMIPNFNGGSSAGAVDPKHSEVYSLLKTAGQRNLKEVSKNLPLYWGPQPFTAGPMYMGAITVFLFILGLFCYKGKEKWWIVVCTVLAVLLAVGSHFMWFTRLFYEFAPLYNKFRTVSMALVILQVTLPLLAFLVLDRIVRDPEARAELKSCKGWLAVGISAGFCLIFALIPSLAGNFSSSSDAGQNEMLTDALVSDRRYLFVYDTVRSLILIVFSYIVLLWGTSQSKGKIPRHVMAAGFICVLILVDMFTVGKRYLNADDFTTKRDFESHFALRPVDEEILRDPDPSYRVLDLTANVFNSADASYWHKSIGGYSPAKLQRYQEFIEGTLTEEINSLYKSISGAKTIGEAEENLPYLEGLAQMNCRYIIVGADLPPIKYKYAKGNAWFASEGVGTIDAPVVTATSDIRLTSYAPNELRYSYTADKEEKVIFSEVYYPMGWTLKLDDSDEVLPIELEGGILRSARVPEGQHTLTMRFDPPSYRIGQRVSEACSIAILLVVLLALGFVYVPALGLGRKLKG